MRKTLVLFLAIVLFASSYSYAGILDSVKYYGEGSFYGASGEGTTNA